MEDFTRVALKCSTVVGLAWLTYQLYGFASFIKVHTSEGSLSRYNKPGTTEQSQRSWALVTGASDGIGKGFVEELCRRGFNIVLHGRNEKKLEGVRQELLKQWPNLQTRLLILDAGKIAAEAGKLEAAVAQLKSLKITVLINNVGGSGGSKTWADLDQYTSDEVSMWIDVNARFPVEITRALLPQLRENGPVLVLNVGSIAGELPAPYLTVYSGCKAFNKTWSRGLSVELLARKTDAEVICLLVGTVSSGSEPRDINWACPSSEVFARSALRKVGCGRTVVYGYWAHELQLWFASVMPTRLVDWALIQLAGAERSKEQARKKTL
ncbi:NAD(P)-binding protein [Polychaeton citri CBS 116435]|uniref:NAD(P)-binding protein n=1 Tax=Polychaeton citri CBS 116435 TaxID=1314669 RepID=A0A9P4QCC3_9PEZI|nr:NAD(P)-binding protein [Polychaeton citri CBS 116435]